MPRLIHGGHTALGNALGFGMQELESNRFAGLRRVIDLSGDGRNNDGRPLRAAREEVVKHGITINGLAILNELPLLDHYFRNQLIGGEGGLLHGRSSAAGGRRSHPSSEVAASTEPKPFRLYDSADQ